MTDEKNAHHGSGEDGRKIVVSLEELRKYVDIENSYDKQVPNSQFNRGAIMGRTKMWRKILELGDIRE